MSNDISPVPEPKGNYGRFVTRPLVSLFEKVAQRHEPIENDVPQSFEKMDVAYGFVMYETILKDNQKDYKNDGTDFVIESIRDRAIVYLDQVCTDNIDYLSWKVYIDHYCVFIIFQTIEKKKNVFINISC